MNLVVYKITNLKNKRVYIGSTCNFEARKAEHLGQLRQGKHSNRFLQAEFRDFKESTFDFSIIQDDFQTRDAMLLREYELILKNKGNHYNIDTNCPVVTGRSKGKYKAPHSFQGSFIKRAKHKRRPKYGRRIKTDFPIIDKILAHKKERENRNAA